MQNSYLHVVCLDVPYPPNYGGAMDMYYRIKALHALGYKIILHSFEYGRGKQQELANICEKVFYYSRKSGISSHFSTRPYIVQSRINPVLNLRLKEDNYPIWLEGLHCCGILEENDLKDRAVFVRMHNIEQDYYSALAQQSSGWKRAFFLLESKKIAKYESILAHATAIFAIQSKDVSYFKKLNQETFLLPAAFPLTEMENYETKDYHLFHGNLSVPENEQAAIWIIKNVIQHLPEETFVIAGKDPSDKLKTLVQSFPNMKLFENPRDSEMNRLIGEAKNHLLYTHQSTGVKLKLINVLQSNGHVIANPKMVEGTTFGSFCRIAHSAEDYIRFIQNNAEPMSCTTRERWKYLQEIRPENALLKDVIPYLSRYL